MSRHASPDPPHRWLEGWETRLGAAAGLLIAAALIAITAPAVAPDARAAATAEPRPTTAAPTTDPTPTPSAVAETSQDLPTPISTPQARTEAHTATTTASTTTTRSTTAAPPAQTGEEPAVTAPATTTAAAHTPPAAPDLIGYVNASRADAGCGPLTADPFLMSRSQAHSDQQAADDVMRHSNDGVAENVAYGYDTAAAVHEAWLGSPPHRANVLDCSFALIGWGTAVGASGRYWTEQFA